MAKRSQGFMGRQWSAQKFWWETPVELRIRMVSSFYVCRVIARAWLNDVVCLLLSVLFLRRLIQGLPLFCLGTPAVCLSVTLPAAFCSVFVSPWVEGDSSCLLPQSGCSSCLWGMLWALVVYYFAICCFYLSGNYYIFFH